MSFAQPVAWIVVCSAVIGLALTLIALGLRRQNLEPARRRLALSLNLVAGAALWALLVQPVSRPGSSPLVTLWTPAPGSAGSHRSVPDQRGYRRQLAGFDSYPLFQSPPTSGVLEVRGGGLPLASWPTAKFSMQLKLAPLPPGVVDVQFPERLTLGQPLRVSGRVQGFVPTAAAVSLLIEGAEQARAVPGSDSRFGLSVVPRREGPVTYQLVGRDDSGSVLFTHSVPVEMRPPLGPHVAIALSAPLFEAQALQRWLIRSARGLRSDVVLGPTVTRSLEFGNEPPASDWLLQPARLDLLITDVSWLNALSPARSSQLEAAVRGGLGLMALVDGQAAPPFHSLLAAFRLSADAPLGTLWQPGGTPPEAGQPAATELTLGQLRAAGGRALQRDIEQRVLIASAQLGGGKVTLSLLADSHSALRSGGVEGYDQLWSQVINHTTRRTVPALWVEKPLPVVWEGEWVHLCSIAGCERRVVDRAGWQRLTLGDESTWAYAHKVGSWQAWRSQALARQTAIAAELATHRARDEAAEGTPYDWLWWTILLLAAASGWLEQAARGAGNVTQMTQKRMSNQ